MWSLTHLGIKADIISDIIFAPFHPFPLCFTPPRSATIMSKKSKLETNCKKKTAKTLEIKAF